jgi:hypothetical protein
MARLQSEATGVLGGPSTHRSLDELAQELNEICRSATIDLVFRVGAFIISRLFGGNVASWERGGARRVSFRALAKRGDLVLSPSALCRAVSIYALIQRSGGRDRWRHLGASHFQEVLALRAEEQVLLLGTAEDNRWSVARLRGEVSLRKQRVGPRIRAMTRDLRSMSERLAKCRNAIAGVEAELEEANVNSLRESVTLLRDALDSFDGALAARTTAPNTSEDDTHSDLVGKCQ